MKSVRSGFALLNTLYPSPMTVAAKLGSVTDHRALQRLLGPTFNFSQERMRRPESLAVTTLTRKRIRIIVYRVLRTPYGVLCFLLRSRQAFTEAFPIRAWTLPIGIQQEDHLP